MDSEWISVKDRLPENENDVLAFVEYDQFPITAYYNQNSKEWKVGSQIRDYVDSYEGGIVSELHKYKVTHWQPLPPPPKTEGLE